MVNVLRTTSALAMVATSFGFADAGNFKCTGINYNIRAGPDWAPANEKCKPASLIATELALLKGVTDTIRLYSLTDCDQATVVVPAAIEAGLKVELGMWVDSSASSFEAEKAAFKTLLESGVVQSEHIVGIHVGSEDGGRGDFLSGGDPHALQGQRGAAGIPLTIADIGDTYSAYPKLIEAVDYVSANYFPFWEKTDIDVAAKSFYKRFSALVQTASTYNKEVVIGETGWASDGVGAGASPATAANAAKYFYDFYTLATEKNLMYYYFSGFDEAWKLPTLEANETVEAYFGLFTKDGVLKDSISAMFDNNTGSFNGSDSATITLVGGDASTTTAGGDDATSGDATQNDTTSDGVEDDSTSITQTSTTTTSTSHKDCTM
ncbi:hypothetical protein AM588_10001297 [Phytophthora nicotianae]|uniref:glucan endo-1,3-beta-D-glucosidase n=1 Tax=Phytophthora nicotianae TaxID=4792 RepID=A0A0W8CT89_PHYNI|nr:hypothetical protein AM588_10001297 [Phytophthora nicotianae]